MDINTNPPTGDRGPRGTFGAQTESPTANRLDIQAHQLADIFPLMSGAEFDELVADIKANGLLDPIVIFDSKILDGRNRYRACLAAGVEPILMQFKGDDPAGFVISMNMRRRHLTAEQKREVIAKLIKATPEKSDRQIARQIDASPTTVGTVRAKMESTGDVSKLDTRTDSKGRKQPASKAAPKSDIRSNRIAIAWNRAAPKHRREFAMAYRDAILRIMQDNASGCAEAVRLAADRAEMRAATSRT